MQQGYPSTYQPEVAKIKKHQQFYRVLLCRYKVCISCVYRIFGVLTPKFYSDNANSAKLMAEILELSQQKCKKENTPESYRFMHGEFKMWYEQSFSKQKGKQHFCWLCLGILQTKFLQQSSHQVIEKVKAEHFAHKLKYKLMTKIDNLFAMKLQIFCNLALAELNKQQIIGNGDIQSLRKQLIIPLFQKTGLDIKTVFKWKLSTVINQRPAEIFTLSSTINEDEQTVIVNIQVEQMARQIEQAITNLVGANLGLQKVKTKKGRIDLQENNNYETNWTVGLINRLTQITNAQWLQILQKSSVERLRQIQIANEQQFISIKMELQSLNLLFCGKYVKFSRYLSQTPWIINKQRLTQSSLQEQVQKKIIRFFYPQSIPIQKINIKFHAGGREDIDVRMLKGGRPFVIQFVSPRKSLGDISIQQILQKIEQNFPQQSKNLPSVSQQLNQEQQQLIKCNLFQFYINTSTELAKVHHFSKTNPSYISKQLKQAEIEKIKHYVCYIKSEQEFEPEDKIKLESLKNLALLQKTPIRVLHRRTLMYRDKFIHKMLFHPATKFSGVLEIWASAGTYIKEFVHGDLNRTVPNVGSIINKTVDILQLDVGSLKQGEWVEGDEQVMKLGVLAWESSS